MQNTLPPPVQEQLNALAAACRGLSDSITQTTPAEQPAAAAKGSVAPDATDATVSEGSVAPVATDATDSAAQGSDAPVSAANNSATQGSDATVSEVSDATDATDSAAQGSDAPVSAANNSATLGSVATYSEGSVAPVATDATVSATQGSATQGSDATVSATQGSATQGSETAVPAFKQPNSNIKFNSSDGSIGTNYFQIMNRKIDKFLKQIDNEITTAEPEDQDMLRGRKVKYERVKQLLQDATTEAEVNKIIKDNQVVFDSNSIRSGGTRKPRMHRRKKTQRKRSKTIKKKNRAGKRKYLRPRV